MPKPLGTIHVLSFAALFLVFTGIGFYTGHFASPFSPFQGLTGIWQCGDTELKITHNLDVIDLNRVQPQKIGTITPVTEFRFTFKKLIDTVPRFLEAQPDFRASYQRDLYIGEVRCVARRLLIE